MQTVRLLLLSFMLFSYSNFLTASDYPNILFIIGDDMGADIVHGFSESSNLPQTPNLDKLQTSGISFTNTWAAPVCSATRASLLTGKYGINNGVSSVPGYLKPTEKSIFKEISELTNNAYNIGVVGKWHVGVESKLDHPMLHGADHFMGILTSGVEDYYEWTKVEDETKSIETSYATSYFTDYAENWINAQTQPWMMWLAHVAPHSPFHTPPSHMHSGGSTDSNQGKFNAMIESLDYEIGRLLDSIPQQVLDNTIIIFLGDNGSPGKMLKGHAENHGKSSVYQGGVHVPLIVAGKGVDRINEQEDGLVNISDFYATFAQIVNPDAYPNNTVNDGVSFKHLLSKEGKSERAFNYMGMGQNSTVSNDLFAISDGTYKLIQTANVGQELYNLEQDPYETNNLLITDLNSEEQDILSTLETKLAEIKGVSLCNDNIKNGNETGVDCGGDCEDCDSGENKNTHPYQIVHTGVSDFYSETQLISEPNSDESLYWQDAGRVSHAPSYTNNGDGTINDNNTGLMWAQDMGTKMSYDEAKQAVKTYNLGAYTDWRIPSIKELYSLILFSGQVKGETAITMFIDTDYFIQPIGDTSADEREIDAQTWSSTFYTSLTMNSDSTIFGVNFVDGRIKGYPKVKKQTATDNKMYFRFVRGNTAYGKNDLMDNSDGTISDDATGLMWQQSDDGTARTWLQSINYCEDLELAGYTDWHLPHAKELHSIVDYTRSPDATNSAAIDPLFNTSQINYADGSAGQYPYFWSTSPHKDGVDPYSTAVYIAFGEASGEMNGTLMDVHGAGAQRSDPKTGLTSDYPKYHGPQGDVQMVYNHCRCVRTSDLSNSINRVETVENPFFYPNPVSNGIKFSANSGILDQSLVTIRTINGKSVLQTVLDSNSTINLNHLKSGAYIISVKTGGITLNNKLFKL